MKRRTAERSDVLLVCSSGGHLIQMLALREAWSSFSHVWVTFDKSDARSLLAGEEVVFAHSPTNRSVRNLVRNLLVAWSTIRRLRPRVVLTTGAGVAVPFAWLGRILGAEVIYVESFTRIDGPSVTCRLVGRAANRIYVQWPDLLPLVPRSRYAGTVFGGP
jgi:beta-1,4-N-acetylglucosaminyltransferase